ncbi:MAG: GAF domain-containing protein, partial [Leptolyngbyaceae bacterium]|nr:GAF domain-containing protein [Leptolyngbyaceae bacterium]
IRSNLIVPILQTGQLWGLLLAHQCFEPRQWHPSDIELLQNLATQVAIAVQQAELLKKVQADLSDRKQAEQALRQSEAKNRAILAAIPDLMLRVRRDGLCLDFIHPSHHQIGDFVTIQHHLSEVLPSDLLAQQLQVIERALTTGDLQIYDHQIVKGGKTCYEEVRIAPSGEDEVLVMVRDITERKLAEQALYASEQRFGSLAAAAPVGIYRTDAEGNCIYVNERWCQIAGITAEEALGPSWSAALHPEDRPLVWTEWNRAIESHTPFQLEYRFRQPSGKVIWVFGQAVAERQDDGTITGYVGTITDISYRKQIEEAIRYIAKGVASGTGEAFFHSLVHYLAAILEVDIAMVGTLDTPDATYAKTVALYVDGELQPNLEYDLADTPCSQVLSSQLCHYPDRVQELFPNDTSLQKAGIQSYIGIPLLDGNGQRIGLIAALARRPIPPSEVIDEILRIFAARAAAELERQQATLTLQSLNTELEKRVTQRTAELASTVERLNQEIHDRQQAQVALQKSQTQNQAFLNAIPDLMIRIARDGTYLDFKPAKNVNNMLSYQVLQEDGTYVDVKQSESLPNSITNENRPLHVSASLSEELAQQRMHYVTQALNSGIPQIYEFQVVIDHEIRYREARIVVSGEDEVLTIVRDITERKQAEQQVQQKIERERLLGAITSRIRQSLDLETILNTTVEEVLHILHADRVLVYRVFPGGTGAAIAEATQPGWMKVLNMTFPEEVFPEQNYERYVKGRIFILIDRERGPVLPCLADFLKEIQVRAKIVVPIVQKDTLWGLLIVHQCSQTRYWRDWEITLLQQIANQLAIAIQQAQLYDQIRIELTERQQVEKNLRASEEKYRTVVDTVKEVIFQTDTKGCWSFLNLAWTDITGFDIQES